jgi:hypothetical protein
LAWHDAEGLELGQCGRLALRNQDADVGESMDKRRYALEDANRNTSVWSIPVAPSRTLHLHPIRPMTFRLSQYEAELCRVSEEYRSDFHEPLL